MPPTPPNTTGRVLVKYNANSALHTVAFRYQGEGAPTNTFLEGIDEVLIRCNFLMPENWAFSSWAYQARGADFSIPLGGAPTAFAGTLTPTLADKPAMLSCTGRSVLGIRARFTLVGVGLTPNDGPVAQNYRVLAVASAGVAGIVSALSSSGVVSIEGNAVNWNNYINLGYSRHWQNKARRG